MAIINRSILVQTWSVNLKHNLQFLRLLALKLRNS